MSPPRVIHAPPAKPLLARDELRHVEHLAVGRGGGHVAGARSRLRVPPARRSGGRSPRPAVDALDLGDHAGVDRLHVAKQPLGVGAQRVGHLTQVLDQLHALDSHVAGGQASLAEQLPGAVLSLLERDGGRVARLLDRRVSIVLRLDDDRQCLAGRGRLGLLGDLAGAGGLVLCLGDDRQRLPGDRLLDLGGVGPRVLGDLGGLLLRPVHDLRRLLLGGLDAVLGRLLALGDAVAHALLGLGPQTLRRLFGRGHDRGDVVRRGGRAGGRAAPGRRGRRSRSARHRIPAALDARILALCSRILRLALFVYGHAVMVERVRSGAARTPPPRRCAQAGKPPRPPRDRRSHDQRHKVTSGGRMSERRYDPKTIEPKWQQVWADEHTWEVSNDPAAAAAGHPKSYVLEMLPYPSGEPHIGHLKNYSLGDAIAHFHRRTGRYVLHPMGYDAFGLPAENHAIRTGVHPRKSTDESIAAFQRAFRSWGISIDWSREFATHEPTYYRWTQWIFLKLLERGLAYRKEAAVNWCPNDQTVLANEQVIDGRCERCGHEVEVRQLEQWFLRITDYADRLLDDLDTIDWPEHVKAMQRNWIGRSIGAEVTFRNEELGIDYPVFTTRPDTLFGATFFVMAPEHPDVFRLAAGTDYEQQVHEYVNRSLSESVDERGATEKPKTGVPLGRTVTNPVTGEQIPMFVADYVLMEYGTGAIMAVPAHDERDFAFAQAFGLPIRHVIAPADGQEPPDDRAFVAHGETERLINSGEFTGLGAVEGNEAIIAWLERRGIGHASVNYRLRDWLVSRQRYWGCPIPIVYCDTHGMVAVREDQLPVELPDVEDYKPRGRSPLA